MAQLGTPIDPGPLAELAAKWITTRSNTSGTSAAAKHEAPQAWIDANPLAGETAQAIKAAWANLATWKKYRWALCAWKHGDHTAAPNARRGSGGFALFTRCWREQVPRKHLLPVSPCSRRATSNNASFWDYTP